MFMATITVVSGTGKTVTLFRDDSALTFSAANGAVDRDGAHCMECTFRERGQGHHHEVLAYVYDGMVQEGWFFPNRIEWVRVRPPEHGLGLGLMDSWTYQRVGDEEYLKLTVPDQFYVWKLTDQFNDGGKRLGVWPD